MAHKAAVAISDYHYIGVATEADLIVVRKWGLSKGDNNFPPGAGNTKIEAISNILDQARKLETDATKPPRPVLIN